MIGPSVTNSFRDPVGERRERQTEKGLPYTVNGILINEPLVHRLGKMEYTYNGGVINLITRHYTSNLGPKI